MCHEKKDDIFYEEVITRPDPKTGVIFTSSEKPLPTEKDFEVLKKSNEPYMVMASPPKETITQPKVEATSVVNQTDEQPTTSLIDVVEENQKNTETNKKSLNSSLDNISPTPKGEDDTVMDITVEEVIPMVKQ